MPKTKSTAKAPKVEKVADPVDPVDPVDPATTDTPDVDPVKVLLQLEANAANTRKSEVTRSIARKVNTAQFETLEIRETWTEEITWKSLDERAQKLRNWETLLLQSYKETHDRVLGELGQHHKQMFGANAQNVAVIPTAPPTALPMAPPVGVPNGIVAPVPVPPPVGPAGGEQNDLDLLDSLPDI
jgi:predicted component of type VI protein secretion system